MAFKTMFFLLLLVLFSCYNDVCMANTTNQSKFFALMNKSLSGASLSNWDATTNGDAFCTYNGIICDDQQNIVQLNITSWSLSGNFPNEICNYLPKLRVLRVGYNKFNGAFPRGILNCSSLEELNMTSIFFTGSLPDFSPLKNLKILDLSNNYFSGDFPMSITNLTNLEIINFNENTKLNLWKLPETMTKLKKLKSMVLMSCMLHGEIPPFIGNMTSLIDLELGGNKLTGRIPKEISALKNLRQLELYYNYLEGEIPGELGNLTELVDLDMSVNKLTGKIPESICRLPKLEFLQAYNNSLTGEFPGVIANSTTLRTLSLYDNFLTGVVPPNLGKLSPMIGLDLSENRFSGKLPEWLCNGGELEYLLVLENEFSGEIPESYKECKSLLRFRVSNNNLDGEIPQGVFSLPRVSIIDVGYNNLSGSISGDIRNAKNLSELFMQGNRISGFIPSEISLAIDLVKIDLSDNLLSGPIPSEIGRLKWLNLLLLQGNKLSSNIPESISLLKSLNVLDLSNNSLTGQIPESLTELLPNSLNFANNHFSGPIPVPFIKGGLLESFSGNPSLCVPAYYNSTSPSFHICSRGYNREKINYIWVIGISVGILILGSVLFLRKWLNKHGTVVQNDENTLPSSFFSYDVKSFHRLSFDQREIIDAMVDKNIVGYGGSGTVYKIELNEEVVAVKKLWSRKNKHLSSSDYDDQLILNKELKTEVETLGSIRHKNIVKLYCCFSSVDCSLLVYEYMRNGDLWNALHRGKVVLDWPTRHRIALGIAQGLAYLHHDLMPPIIHRDIKSTNILLDVDYQPKVADFGIAKVLQARGSKDSTTTVIAGTYGYLAPEYAYSSKATTKCDVYSFGVVLMELITGKKPVEAEFGENQNIIYWVSNKVETKEGVTDVLDKRVVGSFKEDMIKVLRVAIRCTCMTPTFRPTMNEVVQLLIEADPCKFDCCKSSNKIKETTTDTKPKNEFDSCVVEVK